MQRIIDFLRNIDSVQNLFLVIAVLLAAGAAWVSLLKFYFDIRDLFGDLRGRFGNKEYKVKRTILKVIAKNDQTQFIKLRTLRVFKDLNILDIDRTPELKDQDEQGYLDVSDGLSIPGVVRETHTHQLKVDFRTDERPKAREDYTYVTSYVIKGTMQDLWGEPGIIATKPVGSESLTVEFFCAPRWCFKRNSCGKPEIKAYYYLQEDERPPKDKVDIPSNRIFPDGDSYVFDKTEGPIDWIRVIVKKPPKNSSVHIDWDWDEATQKYFKALEASKLAFNQTKKGA